MNRTLWKNRHGMTVIEQMMVVAIMAMVILPTVYFMSQALLFFRATHLRTRLLSDANACHHTIRKIMQAGSAQTLTITTPTGAPPYSHATFMSGTKIYDIQWVSVMTADGPDNKVTMTPGGDLASHVQLLSFIVPDPAVPTQVLITLRLSAPIDSKHTATAQLTNQLVEMRP
jgi:hypothetical protein